MEKIRKFAQCFNFYIKFCYFVDLFNNTGFQWLEIPECRDLGFSAYVSPTVTPSQRELYDLVKDMGLTNMSEQCPMDTKNALLFSCSYFLYPKTIVTWESIPPCRDLCQGKVALSAGFRSTIYRSGTPVTFIST